MSAEADADAEKDALGDSEATLRQVESVLTDLGQASPLNENEVNGHPTLPPSGFLDLAVGRSSSGREVDPEVSGVIQTTGCLQGH